MSSILNEQQDSEESNPNSIHSAPSTTWARTTLLGKALTNRNPNIPVIPPEVLEDDASRKTKAQKTSKNSRVRLNSNEIVENDSPAVEIAINDNKTENGHLNQPHRLMRSTSCRSMPRFSFIVFVRKIIFKIIFYLLLYTRTAKLINKI